MKRILLVSISILSYLVWGNAQSISGTIIDANSDDPMIGATIVEKGTSNGTITDFDGAFSLQLGQVPGSIVISYVGYESKTIAVTKSGNNDLGTISLTSSAFGLDEVVITGVMDIVKDRHTPVAVSTISSVEIQAKAVGNVELPEIAKATPSIYVANQAGGYGDSEVWTRGFDQTNTAFLLNGQPINGMEDGKMYWSNWSGLTDVASAIQIQRGLGASKLAISSVGGTWNFIMKATDNAQGGSVSTTVGNDNYNKIGASYSTGLVNDTWGLTVLFSNWSGDGWGYGTRGNGQTYFISAGYKPAENHSINFLVTGAPQQHDQKFTNSIASHFNARGELDPRTNSNWGIYDGRYYSERTNYYHKPILNLNWDWDINSRSSFSTVLYGSLGRGGGTGGLGGPLTRTESGLIDFDATAANPESNYILRSSVNSHNWIGGVLKYETDLSDAFNLSLGTDLRRYYGDHFRQVIDLFGRPGYQQEGIPAYPNGYTARKEYKATPWAAISDFAPRGDRIAYNNAETIRYAGGFGQLEFAKNQFSAYLQGAISTQDHVRHELFYESESTEDSEKVVNNGYNAKLGLSYAINDHHLFFVNTGIYSRQPFHDVVFVGNSNVVNENTNNEDIFGLELGYKFTANDFYGNVNVYRTAWNNRVEFNALEVQPDGTVRLTNNDLYTAIGMDPYELLFQNQLHTGLELDLGVHIGEDLRLKGFASLGNWEVIGDRDVELYDGAGARQKVDDFVVSGNDVKVGGAPQTSFGIGANWKIFKNLSAEANYLYYDNLYANNGGIKLPSYGVVDLNISYALPLSNGDVLRVIGNVYNLFDELYISKASSSIESSTSESGNWKGINKENVVMFGKTRTANITIKYSF
ncbi:MAG TPA: carboxypeptidase-like regulatory domain-containing protein [Membranihabitans sp.]|nr:carboxypeptidase-like regulatory domain-containing protein [Membranihabitans sp.]